MEISLYQILMGVICKWSNTFYDVSSKRTLDLKHTCVPWLIIKTDDHVWLIQRVFVIADVISLHLDSPTMELIKSTEN